MSTEFAYLLLASHSGAYWFKSFYFFFFLVVFLLFFFLFIYLFIYFNIFIDYAITVVPFPPLHSTPHTHPLPPTFPPYSSCPWVILISFLASTFPILFLPSSCLFSTYHLCYLFSVPYPAPPPTSLLITLHVISISVVLFLF